MSDITNKTIGNKGENIASEYLIKNGFIIIKKNYRFGHYEIDLIAKRDSCLHFVEVKFRSNNSFGYPESFVSNDQKNRIKLAADEYIHKIDWTKNIMFDIISIEKCEDGCKILFFEDSF